MTALLHLTALSLKLNFRNRMAIIYGYLFPLIFLIAFWAIYRNDTIPLALHVGQLLTVTVLGGACFGLPTTIVSERERGMWRRYALAPAPRWVFIVSILAARYVLLLTAALLQLALALVFGMPLPLHPFGLLIAFSLAAFAFMGLGMVIAMLVDNVPSVQALGQCIFLPMLIIGGVAVRLSSLPDWAQHASAFFPGRYAVEALQAGATGPGISRVGFDLAALALTALAGGIAATGMFRWDKSFQPNKAWLLVALGMWLAMGAVAEVQGRAIATASEDTKDVGTSKDYLMTPSGFSFRSAPKGSPSHAETTSPSGASQEGEAGLRSPSNWHDVTEADFDKIAWDHLPPDGGIVSPVARADETPDPSLTDQLDKVQSALPGWAPGNIADPEQRTRNLLAVAAVPDILQMEQVERFVPRLVFARLQAVIPPHDLPKILYWIAMHPETGDDSAFHQLQPLGLPQLHGPTKAARGRIMLYAFKLLGRLTGHIPPL